MAKCVHPGCRWQRFGALELCQAHASAQGDEGAKAAQRERWAKRGKGGGKGYRDRARRRLEATAKKGGVAGVRAEALLLAHFGEADPDDAQAPTQDRGTQDADTGDLFKRLITEAESKGIYLRRARDVEEEKQLQEPYIDANGAIVGTLPPIGEPTAMTARLGQIHRVTRGYAIGQPAAPAGEPRDGADRKSADQRQSVAEPPPAPRVRRAHPAPPQPPDAPDDYEDIDNQFLTGAWLRRH